MGACQCKNCFNQDDDRSSLSPYDAASSTRSNQALEVNTDDTQDSTVIKTVYSLECVDSLILQTLGMVGMLGLVNNREPPVALQMLHIIGDSEDGWVKIIGSLIDIVPLEDPLGPAVITVVLDDIPLPNKETVLKLSKLMNLSKSVKNKKTVHQQRNLCIVLGVLADKLPGPSSIAILTSNTLEFLLSNLDKKTNPTVILYSLIALEKFAQITENKMMIRKYLESECNKSPLLALEDMINHKDYVEMQVGFCARWCLDNLFPVRSRKYSYLSIDTSKTNAMLNSKDSSEYLKLSADGLEARCDAYSFESVRCTFQINNGVWYYEAMVLSSGVMQIGWATVNSLFRNHEGYGIGDDEYSISYDGCRQQLWYNAYNETVNTCRPWKPGDIVGCLINIPEQYVHFYLNGCLITTNKQIFSTSKSGFFAAASFMTFQHCRFNFGLKPFVFPPKNIAFCSFNQRGFLPDDDRIILPKHMELERIRNMNVLEDSCLLCFDDRATVTLDPCKHSGFCLKCTKQLTICPVCRRSILEIIEDDGALISV